MVADDLTSAMDSAAPFAAPGVEVVVLRGAVAAPSSADVVALDADTRRGDEAAAFRATHAAVAGLAAAPLLFKNVDSTVRGHVTVELRAAMAAAGRRLVVLAPAFPAAGRTTSGGVQLVDGVPVAQTEYGRDALHPARTSALRELVGAVDVPVTVVPVRGALPAAGIALVDAASDADLDAAVAQVEDLATVLFVGSPGLARALGRRYGRGGADTKAAAAPGASRLLVVVGTRHPATRTQVARLVAAFGDAAVDLAVHDADARTLVGVLRAPELAAGDAARNAASAVAAALGRRAAELLRGGAFDACVASGGETADALLTALDASRFELLAELEPGIGLALVHDGDATWPLATKAGGFGDPATLVRLHAALCPEAARAG
jgi:uncharacterized protein YgbK (DUF1537 family)